MPAYHSTFDADGAEVRTVAKIVLLPFRTHYRGYWPENDQENYDIVDETLDLFRANSFFRNFEIKGNADRLLIYGILYISDCLSKLNRTMSASDANRTLMSLAVDLFALPGDIGFPLNSLYAAPATKNEADLLRGFLQQFRQEIADRLLKRIYADGTNIPSKHWLAFTKRRFMNKSL